jgi:hypothetical protein
MSRLTSVAILAFLSTGGLLNQAPAPKPAVPLEPISAILDAFKTHQIVALGEGAHGNEQGHAFRLSLIRDPRFAATVNDIVVESGNALYQDVIDRFVRGEEVPYADMRRLWENTTQPNTVWDKAIYEALFPEVRAVNAKLPRERQLRVLLGDPPIDWTKIQSRDDMAGWFNQRERFPADLIRREVLGKQRRGLLIYGDGHLFRVPVSENIVSLLEAEAKTRIFIVGTPLSYPAASDLTTLQKNVAAWPVPSLAVLRATSIGATSMEFFYGPWPKKLSLEDALDALLYIGAPASITMAPVNPRLCADAAYVEMRIQRLTIAAFQPPGAPNPIDRLKQYCASVTTPAK